MTTEVAMREIEEELKVALANTGANLDNARDQFAKFLTLIQPDVDAAIQAQDLMSLSYIKDRVAMQVGRASLGLIYKQQQIVVNTVNTVLRMLVKVAIGAIAV